MIDEGVAEMRASKYVRTGKMHGAHLQQALAELKAQMVVSHSIEELEAMEDE